jgi:hypothetical protein
MQFGRTSRGRGDFNSETQQTTSSCYKTFLTTSARPPPSLPVILYSTHVSRRHPPHDVYVRSIHFLTRGRSDPPLPLPPLKSSRLHDKTRGPHQRQRERRKTAIQDITAKNLSRKQMSRPVILVLSPISRFSFFELFHSFFSAF